MKAWPNVHVVAPIDLASPLQPYDVSFSIRNSGSLPVYNVEVQCMPYRFKTVVTRSAKTAPGPAAGNRRFIADVIRSGEEKKFVCDVVRLPEDSVLLATYADMLIVFRFRPVSFVPLHWPDETQAFYTSRQADGQLRWRGYIEPLPAAQPKY